jgi:hypothetical protein
MKGIFSMDELSLYSLTLAMAKPWRVTDLKFSKYKGRLDVRSCRGAELEEQDGDEAGLRVQARRISLDHLYLVAVRLTFNYSQ